MVATLFAELEDELLAVQLLIVGRYVHKVAGISRVADAARHITVGHRLSATILLLLRLILHFAPHVSHSIGLQYFENARLSVEPCDESIRGFFALATHQYVSNELPNVLTIFHF